MLLLAATNDITAFHVVGGVLALWAVVLSALGVMRHDFPGKGAGQRVVMAISALLVAGAIGTAIGTAKDAPKGGPKGGAEAGKVNKAAPPSGPIKTLPISADPSGQFRFDKAALQAAPGSVRITMNNLSPVPHNIALEGPGGVKEQGPTVAKGGSSEIEATVQPGSYTYFCAVPGHRQAGMQGTLTVK